MVAIVEALPPAALTDGVAELPRKRLPTPGQPRPTRGATKLMEARVSALLKAGSKGKSYCHLFNLRSAFLHGRKMDAPIPGEARLMARRLAREVVQKLVEVALTRPGPEFRETYLNELGQ